MSLLKSGLAVASGTAMSRVTGFMRDILVAKFLFKIMKNQQQALRLCHF
jgi:hypothetical protein